MPGNKSEMKDAIKSKIGSLMVRVMDRVMNTDPFVVEKFRAQKPLYAALVPDEIFKGSHFERRFVTPFGNVWEDLAVTAAEHGLGSGRKGVTLSGTVKEERLRRISEVLNRLEHPEKGAARIRPDWDVELAYIMKGDGEEIPTQVVCDVLAEDTANNLKYAFEIKAPLPNSDQTKVSKEKIMKLYAMEPRQVAGAYYALPYNPYGKREDYAWSFPARWFNMKEDEVVLIGDEFWEKIGGIGTYQAFIVAVNEIGAEYKERIYREFLGIEPPQYAEDDGKLG
jgi:hypothetical protein